MTTSKYNITFLVSSDPNAGALNISNNGATFDIYLDRPLIVPSKAKNIYIETKNATIWYTTPNIVAGVNDQWKITYDDGITSETRQVTIPEGLYNINTLEDKLNLLLYNTPIGAPDYHFPIDLIKLLPDNAENKVVIQFNYSGTQIDFNINNNIKHLLGFTSNLVPASPTVGEDEVVFAEEVAKFNAINYYLIQSTLVSKGLNFNSKYQNIIARVLINGPPNSQITYDPQQTYKIPAPELRGSNFTTITFTLTDDNNVPINTRGEAWSVLFVVHYEVVD